MYVSTAKSGIRNLTPNQSLVAQPPITSNFRNRFHTAQNRKQFLSMSVSKKSKLVRERERNLCTNCLRNTHSLEECTSGSCMLRRKRHHTILHANIDKSRQLNRTNLACRSPKIFPNTILSTAVTNLCDQS